LNRLAFGLLVVAFLVADAGAATAPPPVSPEATAAHLRDEAMAGHSVAYPWVSELTTRIGPRPAGSVQEHHAAQWAVDKLKALGFENVLAGDVDGHDSQRQAFEGHFVEAELADFGGQSFRSGKFANSAQQISVRRCVAPGCEPAYEGHHGVALC
jgi:hypothetical protein